MLTSPARSSLTRLDDLSWLVDTEFREMPGMRLTFSQVRRLCNMSPQECAQVLDYLVSAGLLTQDANDRYCRPH